VVGYSVFGHREGRRRRALALFPQLRSNWKVWAVVPAVALLAMWLRPDAATSLAMRLENNASRLETWAAGAAGIDTRRAFLIGYGPATLSLRTGEAPHNSYIEAVASSGIFFVVSTLLALWIWLKRMRRRGSWDMLWIVPPVLIWGVVETILFNGIETLWMYTMLLGIAVRSRDADLDVSSAVVSRSPARRPPEINSPGITPGTAIGSEA
jgi:hypothetical protein